MSQMGKVCPDDGHLAAWVERRLEPPERSAVTAHLAACDDCRRTVALVATLEPGPTTRPVNELLVQRLAAAARPRPRWPWAVAAAALLSLGLLYAVTRPDPPAPMPPAISAATEPPARAVAAAPPAPLPAPAPVPPPPPKPEPTPPPVVKEPDPVPAPEPVEAPKPPPPPVVAVVKPPPEPPREADPPKPAPRPTEVDLTAVFGAVFCADPQGELLLTRAEEEARKPGRFEQVGFKDVFAGRGEGAGFTVDSRASIVLEKDAEAAVSYFRPDHAYRLEVLRGPVLVDTDGSVQAWVVAGGRVQLALPELAGRLAVELRDDRLAVLLLEGRGQASAGGVARALQPGREVVMAADGRSETRRAETKDRLARLARLRPKAATLFAATFDERKDVVQPWPYTIIQGRVVTDASGAWLEAALGTAAPPILSAGLKPERTIQAATGMVLRFRYRTTLPSLAIALREPEREGRPGQEYAATLTAGARGRWVEAELPLAAFVHEGVPVVPLTRLAEVVFAGAAERRAGTLDVDGVHFFRRYR